MNVVIGAEAALFPEKECISGILLAVQVLFLGIQLLVKNNFYFQSCPRLNLVYRREQTRVYQSKGQ